MSNTLAGNLQRVSGKTGASLGLQRRAIHEEPTGTTGHYHFACDPARTQDLVKALFAVVADFKTTGPSAGQGADLQAALRRDLETDSRQNGHVLNQLVSAYQYGEPIPDPTTLRAVYDGITPSVLREAARAYLDSSRYVKVLLFRRGSSRRLPHFLSPDFSWPSCLVHGPIEYPPRLKHHPTCREACHHSRDGPITRPGVPALYGGSRELPWASPSGEGCGGRQSPLKAEATSRRGSVFTGL